MISKHIYLSSDFKKMDNNCGIPELVLMESAAMCLYKRLDFLNRLNGKITIVCGKGNNGGDGYALAHLLISKGISVCVFSTEVPKSSSSIHYMNLYLSEGGYIENDFNTAISYCDTTVDCIFGFSFHGILSDFYKEIINKINSSDCYVLSADIPSGLTADSCCLSIDCINANATSTFTAKKIALACYPSKSVCGDVFIEDIGIPSNIFGNAFALNDGADFLKLLPQRNPCGHKGSFGTLSALVGSEFMPGAAYLASLAALQSGVGLLRLFSDKYCLNTVSTRLAEPVLSEISSHNEILSKKFTALLIGCGCGREYDDIIKELIKTVKVPAVLDADGINCIAGDIEIYKSMKERFVVTPHEMEMARLLQCDIEYIKQNKIQCALQFSKTYGVVTVLKGASTIVASPEGKLYINNTGNSGLAKGGSGDVLAGLISSLLAQGVNAFDAAVIGVYTHGKAGDILEAKLGQYAMLPSMLPLEIGKILADR